MHQITAQGFLVKENIGKRYVVYSTMYSHGRYLSFHDCTGLSDQQALGKFIVEHSHEVDLLIKQKRRTKKHQSF